VRRASLGVQDFDPEVQVHINRVQPFELVARAVSGLRDRGVAGVNFDLIYGLPGQSEATIRATACMAASLRPDRLALFGYAHVPWLKPHQSNLPADLLPGEWSRYGMARAAAAELAGAGYRAIGFDHFALPRDSLCRAADEGALRRNFQGYTADECGVLLGLGASAIGTLPDGYVQNESRIAAYCRAVERDGLPVVRGVAREPDDARRHDLIQRLLCDFSVRVEDAALIADSATLDAMIGDGLAAWNGDRLSATERGRPLVRTLGSVFDRHLAGGQARHSAPV
jgi:oxygen-independent coproporphyrinogen-3 oxidase